jgi:hypothetical protein
MRLVNGCKFSMIDTYPFFQKTKFKNPKPHYS